jgi:hypothetical protein
MATKGDVLHLFRQALNSELGHISVCLSDEREVLALQKRCHTVRDRERGAALRKFPHPMDRRNTPVYDVQSRPIGYMRLRGDLKPETPYDCLSTKVRGNVLIIFRTRDWVEPPARSGMLPEAKELTREEILSLPPWPLRSERDRQGRIRSGGMW